MSNAIKSHEKAGVDQFNRTATETELADSQAIFKLLVDAVDEYGIFALDLEGRIVTWNAGAERLKGYTADEVIGTHFSRFYEPSDIARNHPAHELEIARRAGKYEEEGWRVRKDGSRFWANVVITALRDPDGELRGYGKVTRDLSARRESELRLRESEERFRMLVSSVTDYALITLTPQGRVMSWNAGAERIKGYRERDIVGKHFSIFYPKSEIELGKPEIELRIAADEGRYEEEGWRVRKDGTMFWANVIVTPMRDDKGELKGFAKVTKDLTSRKQAEEALRQSQERYKMLIDGINDYAVMYLDTKGRITSWNTGAQRITGYEAKEVLGTHVSKFYTPADLKANKIETELRVARETGRYEEEGERVRKNGEIYWANVVINAIRDEFGNVLGFSKITRDVTKSKLAAEKLRDSEERLRTAYAGLEITIAERTRELREEKEKAELAVKARDEFFSMASHELKTPLSALKMQTQIRKRAVKRGNLKDFETPERILELCQDDERQVDRLNFLVDNMLDISRLTSGNFVLSHEELDLKEVVEDVAHRMDPILKESGNELTVKTPESIVGEWDRHRLEQVLTNLLSNAGRYAAGKPVEITLERSETGARISVRDQGRGIAKESQDRIFAPFERANAKTATAGLGLGLYITKQIVDAHRGEIRINSSPGEGATFIIDLPLHAPETTENEGTH